MDNDVETALAIIEKSYKSGKLLTEFKTWDYLDFDDRMKALDIWNYWKDAVNQGLTINECREIGSITMEDVL